MYQFFFLTHINFLSFSSWKKVHNNYLWWVLPRGRGPILHASSDLQVVRVQGWLMRPICTQKCLDGVLWTGQQSCCNQSWWTAVWSWLAFCALCLSCLGILSLVSNRSLCNCFMSSRSVLSQCFLEIRMCGQCQSPSRKPSGCPCHPGSEHQSAVLNRTCTWEGTCSAFWWSDQPWEELSLVEYCKHTAHLCLPKDLWVRDLVLPSWVIYKGS